MPRSLRGSQVCLLTFALFAACKDSSRSEEQRDATTHTDAAVRLDAAVEAGVDASSLPNDCAHDPRACDAGRPPTFDAGAQERDAGNLKPPVDAGGTLMRDGGQRDAGVGCAAGVRKCTFPNGAYGICTPSGTCGGCAQTSECVEVYGGGFVCNSLSKVCFPQI